jgi:isoleucyl-tRNA synthetase
MDPSALKSALEGKGIYEIKLDNKTYEIGPEDVSFVESMPDNLVAVEAPLGRVIIDVSLTSELLQEGLAKELIRRIQDMRKDLDLSVDDHIEVTVEGGGRLESIEELRDYISTETRAVSMLLGRGPAGEAYSKEWEVEGDRYKISVRRVPE